MVIINSSAKSSISASRRQALKSISKAVVGVTAITQAPYVFAKQRTQLRVLGTHVTLQEKLRQKAMEDLDIDLIFESYGSAAVLQKALMKPQSFDLYEQWSNSLRPDSDKHLTLPTNYPVSNPVAPDTSPNPPTHTTNT